LIQIEVSDLRVENEKLRKVLNRSQTETEQVKKTVDMNSTQYRKDLRSIQSRNLELELELVHAKEELERYKIMATSADEKNKDTSKSLTFKVDRLDAALKKCKLEKSLLFEEVNNLRLLLSRSEGALATINNCEDNNESFDSSRGLKEKNIETDRYATELNEGRSLKSKISKPKFLPVGETQNDCSLLGSSTHDANHPNIRREDVHHEQRIREKKPSDSASCVYELPQFRHLKSFSNNYEHDIDQEEISSPQMKNDHPSSAIFSDEVNYDAGIVQTKLNNDEIGPEDASAKVVVHENAHIKTNGMETSTPDCVPISKTESEILLMNSDGSISDSSFGGAQIDTSKNAIGTGTPHSDGDTIELKPINVVEKNDTYVDDDHGYDSSDFETESLSG
jgi:regulator of replication initiation timing